MTRNYITYLLNPDQHTNSYITHAGMGLTPEESRDNSSYYNNQTPFTVTVPLSRAPAWAVQEARESLLRPCCACGHIHPPEYRLTRCVDLDGCPLPITKDWPTDEAFVEYYEAGYNV